jgi:predicted nucleotidyltransferase
VKFGLSDMTIKKIHSVFQKHTHIDQAVVYGSRAKGNYRPGSDIDLTLYGDNLDQRQCSNIAEELDELLLPYMIDLSVFEQLKHADIKAHIQRVGKVFYHRP